jgi:hypothetical protein
MRSAASERPPGTWVCRLSLPQAAWTTVTAICVIAAVLLLLNGYDGYSAVLLFVALSAAINLLP